MDAYVGAWNTAVEKMVLKRLAINRGLNADDGSVLVRPFHTKSISR